MACYPPRGFGVAACGGRGPGSLRSNATHLRRGRHPARDDEQDRRDEEHGAAPVLTRRSRGGREVGDLADPQHGDADALLLLGDVPPWRNRSMIVSGGAFDPARSLICMHAPWGARAVGPPESRGLHAPSLFYRSPTRIRKRR